MKPTFETSTTVPLGDAANVLAQVLAHLREHDLLAIERDNTWQVDYADTKIRFSVLAGSLHAQVAASSAATLYEGKMMVVHHIQEFGHCKPEAIQWQGDNVSLDRPPAFRLITVQAVSEVGPHMRRVRFNVDDLARYDQNDNIHCKLIFPQPDVSEPEWPTLAADGMPQFPKGDKRLDIRTYTIRRISAPEGWFEVDFVLHEDAGPGSRWAAQAVAGQQIGLSGPGGRTARSAGWMLLGGDETALPAIARITEALPADTNGVVLIEVQSPADQIPLATPAGMSVQWLHRGNAAAGTTTLLEDAVTACTISKDEDRFVWVGAEFSTAQTVRNWLREAVGLGSREQLVVAYWRRGLDETQMKSAPGRATADEQAKQAGA
ncbi:siderophore-interacting protein [Advenella mimigardefordensis]|uniref:FAD-binding, siderophore-interacting domain-containing protein n=1 Tax=Advenella mimigardefordensis (strain DSM 17166 / LMG 22922 / DPN7) TaxID=1247726 RepID=W0P6C0_ADVMD|nr:siderophore-interacting protein [Advenella mimigardefordensis]AHG62286.1 FAD-binding, siderophore-interacting domain-containing protein [Advenella mimigardefordensis DPN7]